MSRSVRSTGLPVRQTRRVLPVEPILSRSSSSISTLSLSAKMAIQERGWLALAITNSEMMVKIWGDQPKITVCPSSMTSERPLRSSSTFPSIPLVKTPMIAPTSIYEHVPTLTPEEAADLVVQAIVERPVRIATRLGIFGEVVHALLPKVAQIIMNTMFRMFPDAPTAQGGKPGAPAKPTADQIAMAQLMRGIHF